MRNLIFILLGLGALFSATVWALPKVSYPEVKPGTAIAFPRDHGSHDDYRTEWWYFTGWLETEDGEPLGFQMTFFRSRPDIKQGNPSAFSPDQIIFAHAALSDPAKGKLIHDQRIARSGFDIAYTKTGDTDLRLLDWQLQRSADGNGFVGKINGEKFSLDLVLTPTQPVMLNGKAGYSQKGPRPSQASYYFSMPQLLVSGFIGKDGKRMKATGQAWLDHEWSSDVLPKNAVGWDWTGLNFDDGSALMVFQVRGRDGDAVYAGGTFRDVDGRQIIFAPHQVRFVPKRRWVSPETGAVYPVEAEFAVQIDDQWRRYPLKPLFDAQELTGPFTPTYWEGAVTTTGGRGYLEMTGYDEDISL
ncbi:MAG: lipocalin-like domain-containing protein [Pseudomonadota bacterium]